jgi:hypothetical protein
VKLKGIIFVHRISDTRFQQSDSKALKLLEHICGPHALSNVVLTTNMWHQVEKHKGLQRSAELRENQWAPIIQQGASVQKFDGTPSSAQYILGQLLGKQSVTLQIHREIIYQKKMLGETTAGTFLSRNRLPPSVDAAIPDSTSDVFQRRVDSEFRCGDDENGKMKDAVLKGFIGLLGLIVGLGNLFVQIGVV